MPKKTKNSPQAGRRLRLSHQALLEAKVREAYSEAALRAANDGISDLYETYTELAEHHKGRWGDFKSQASELR